MQKRRALAALVGAAALTALVGCASLPSPEVMKAETASFQLPKLPEAGKAMVYVVRPALLGWLIRFNVFVDDQEATSKMGNTQNKQYIYKKKTTKEHKK